MEQVGKIFSIGMPVFAILVLGEKLYGHYRQKDTVPWMDALASSYSGITFVIRAFFGFGLSLVSYDFLVKHIALIHPETSGLVYMLAFVVLDFQGYWGHRLVHEVNFLWNRHLIHHSSEEYNLACALRQSVSDFVHFLFFLSIPAALLGLSPTVIAVVFPIHKFAQYWYHTRLIGNLGFLEHIIVTPSHHRVHHALNPIYLDKNYSGIFIIWDKLFGTFQKELESEPPVYGVTRPAHSWNPIAINFEHLILLMKDAWRSDNWLDKFTIWFRPTGWRPAGFEEIYPVQKIKDPYHFEKFNPPYSRALLSWSLIQFFILFFLVIYVSYHISQLGMAGLYGLAVYVFVQVYSATELMNRNKWAPVYALLGSLISGVIYLHDSSWFGIDRVATGLPWLWVAYHLLQTILSFVFSAEILFPAFKKQADAAPQ